MYNHWLDSFKTKATIKVPVAKILNPVNHIEVPYAKLYFIF